MATTKLGLLALLAAALLTAAVVDDARAAKLSSKRAREHEPFPNWLGEVDLNLDAAPDEAKPGEGLPDVGVVVDPEDVPGPSGSITKRLVAWKPRIFGLDGILSPEEAAYALSKAQSNLDAFDVLPKMYKPNGVVTHWEFSVFDDILIYNIARRVSTITMLPLENFADIEIVRFGDASSYLDLHSDVLPGILREKPGKTRGGRTDPGQRVARVVLNIDPKNPTSIVFPRAERMHDDQKQFYVDRKCKGAVGVTLEPTQSVLLHTMDTKGDAEWYYGDYKTCGKTSKDSSFHENTSWLMVFSINAYSHNKCHDLDPNCESWAEKGECDNNPAFMFEKCKQACDKC